MPITRAHIVLHEDEAPAGSIYVQRRADGRYDACAYDLAGVRSAAAGEGDTWQEAAEDARQQAAEMRRRRAQNLARALNLDT